MSTKKLTYSQCIEIFGVLNKIDLNTETKFKHATVKLLKEVKRVAEEYNDKLSDINIEYCHVDEKGIIQKDAQGGFVFKKEELKNREKAVKELNKEEVEIKVFIVPVTKEIEEKVNPYSIDILRGVLFEELAETE